MTKDLVLSDTARYEEMHKVVTLHLEGRNPSYIAKNLNVRRADVLNYIDDFKKIAKDDELLRARAKEVVHEFDQTHNRVLSELWEVAEAAKLSDDLKTWATAAKHVSDVAAKRVEVLQKSGLLSDAEIGDQMAQMQEEHEDLVAILRDVTGKCNHCKFEVAARLGQIYKTAVPVPVTSDRE